MVSWWFCWGLLPVIGWSSGGLRATPRSLVSFVSGWSPEAAKRLNWWSGLLAP